MKFNPITNTLYNNDGKLIKKMYCPYVDLKWDDLESIDNSMDRFCSICENSVIETKDFTDDVLYELLQKKPDTCLKIDINQENIRIVNHD
jgi:hypothetical protein